MMDILGVICLLWMMATLGVVTAFAIIKDYEKRRNQNDIEPIPEEET